jgi:hypothetical protein
LNTDVADRFARMRHRVSAEFDIFVLHDCVAKEVT